MTLTFQGHVTSSVTWPLDSRWSISYWWSFGPKSVSLTVSEIFRPKHHVLIDTMLNRHCVCAYHVTCNPYVKFKYIFQFLTPTLPIHYVTFIKLRWRKRRVLSVTSNVIKAKSSEKFSVQKFAKFWPFRGPGDEGVWKVAIFTAKGTSLRECTSFEPFCVKIGWGVWPAEVGRKKVRKSREAPIGMMCRR